MLRLRPYKSSDAERIVEWFGDEVTFYLWSAGKIGAFPIESCDLDRFYQKTMEEEDFFVMVAVDEENNPVGQVSMRYVDGDYSTIRFGFVIVDNNRRGNGYGSAMLRLARKYAFVILSAKRVTIGVFEQNKPAKVCYESIGFREQNTEPVIYTVASQEWKCIEMEDRD